jgi:hypothetical protein
MQSVLAKGDVNPTGQVILEQMNRWLGKDWHLP